MRDFFETENTPVEPIWKNQKQPTEAQLEQLGEVIQTVATSADQLWRPHLTEQERRIDAAIYRAAMRDLRRGGPLSDYARQII